MPLLNADQDVEIDEADQYADVMLDFRDWCEGQEISFKVAVARATKIYRLSHGSVDRSVAKRALLLEIAMGFEVVTIGSSRIENLQPGQVSIQKNGGISFVNSDLINRSITANTDVVALVDRLTKRVAFRKARDGEPGQKPKLSKSKKTAELRVARALAELGIKPHDAGVAKRYSVTIKEDMLVIQL